MFVVTSKILSNDEKSISLFSHHNFNTKNKIQQYL